MYTHHRNSLSLILVLLRDKMEQVGGVEEKKKLFNVMGIKKRNRLKEKGNKTASENYILVQEGNGPGAAVLTTPHFGEKIRTVRCIP